ncbi:MAG: cupredoxin domain-containing protein [Chloroflexi bacterium]|nr:cupredoxin domain-containing protein [Chloroflexota bacterium]
MKHPTQFTFKSGVLILVALIFVVTACATPTTQMSSATQAPAATAAGQAAVQPITVQQSSAPKAVQPQTAAILPSGFAAPAPGPNLLATTWPERLGIIVSEMKPATGKVLLNPKAGDLWFFSNSSTTWGATNTKNAVWVIDAKTKQTVAEIAPFDGEGNSSHGIAVSGDAKFIYLPMLGKDNRIDVLDGRTLEVVQTIKTLGRPHHQKLWHDPKTNKDLIIGEDFNWNFSGSGFYVIDPSQNNAIVGGLSNGDFQGNPYVSAGAADGSSIVVTIPAPMSAFRDKMDGWVAKVNPKTWKVTGLVPMIDPLYPVVSLDGKFAYVTSGGEARIYKINLETMKEEGEVQTGPGPWGATLSYDQTRLYTADKGEGPGYNQQGRTTTIIDLQTMGVVDVVPIGLTTDHALLSPDGKEVWFTSNAEHAIYVLDTATHKMTVIKDPGDGDIHGGVWVQYKDDGKGGVVGEVVADYAGLHGSALDAQRKYVSEPTATIAFNGNGFTQKSLSVTAGQAIRLTIKNVAGTSAGKLTFQSDDMGIKPIILSAGDSQEVRWTVPTKTGDLKATVLKSPVAATNNTMSIVVKAAEPAATSAAPAAAGPQIVNIKSEKMLLNVTTVTVKAGQPVRFVFVNTDDEKHNLVGIGETVQLLSPDVSAGQTITYNWTAPATPGTYKVVCAYHPAVTFSLVVQP